MRRRTYWTAAIGAAAVLFGCCLGCSHQSTGETPAHVATANRLDQIAQYTGGDWNKATPADKQYILGVAYGSETSAKQILAMRVGPKGPPVHAGPPAKAPTSGAPGAGQ